MRSRPNFATEPVLAGVGLGGIDGAVNDDHGTLGGCDVDLATWVLGRRLDYVGYLLQVLLRFPEDHLLDVLDSFEKLEPLR